MARRCGAKRICKSKCTKHLIVGAIFEVPMSKWHAAVARSTFSSQNAQNTTISDQFWKFRCSKMARGCGAKHIFKSKCAKHHNLGPILEVPMFKNGTRLWREAHFQVKMHKTSQSRTNFGSSDVQKWHAAVARSAFASQNVQNTCFWQHFERFLTDSLTN